MTEGNKGLWSETEHTKFLEALYLYGPIWKEVQKHILTRSVKQTKSHSQKFFNGLKRKFYRDRINHLCDPSFIIAWTVRYIQESYLPVIESANLILLDFSKRYDRLVRIIMNKIDSKKIKSSASIHFKKIKFKKTSCCCKRLGNKICDCFYPCCSLEFNSNEKEKPSRLGPIFHIKKIEKSPNSSIKYSENYKTNNFNVKIPELNHHKETMDLCEDILDSSPKKYYPTSIFPMSMNENSSYHRLKSAPDCNSNHNTSSPKLRLFSPNLYGEPEDESCQFIFKNYSCFKENCDFTDFFCSHQMDFN